MRINYKKTLLFLFAVFLSHLAGFLGSIATVQGVKTWYKTLNKPFFNPPNWVFLPVWLLLYTLMGISFYLILVSKKTIIKKRAILFFYSQLILNSLWSFIFFVRQNLLEALIEIFVLLIFILLTTKEFYKINKKAAYLLIPYILWVSFALILNFSIYLLN